MSHQLVESRAKIVPVNGVTVYKGIVAPHYDLCSTIMLNYSEVCIYVLQRTQNRAMRTILMLNRYTRVADMLEVLGFMSIRRRIYYNVVLFVCKMKNGLTPLYLTGEVRMVKERHRYPTGNKCGLDIKATRTETAKKRWYTKGLKCSVVYHRN